MSSAVMSSRGARPALHSRLLRRAKSSAASGWRDDLWPGRIWPCVRLSFSGVLCVESHRRLMSPSAAAFAPQAGRADGQGKGAPSGVEKPLLGSDPKGQPGRRPGAWAHPPSSPGSGSTGFSWLGLRACVVCAGVHTSWSQSVFSTDYFTAFKNLIFDKSFKYH